jgi:hypothetical protein
VGHLVGHFRRHWDIYGNVSPIVSASRQAAHRSTRPTQCPLPQRRLRTGLRIVYLIASFREKSFPRLGLPNRVLNRVSPAQRANLKKSFHYSLHSAPNRSIAAATGLGSPCPQPRPVESRPTWRKSDGSRVPQSGTVRTFAESSHQPSHSEGNRLNLRGSAEAWPTDARVSTEFMVRSEDLELASAWSTVGESSHPPLRLHGAGTGSQRQDQTCQGHMIALESGCTWDGGLPLAAEGPRRAPRRWSRRGD